MQPITDLFQRVFNLPELLQWAGLFGIAAIIFSGTGLLVGVFLPGDSLLVTAGLLAARGYLNVYALAPLLTVAAICGNAVGHFIRRAPGPRNFNRETSQCFTKKNTLPAHALYAKYETKQM